MKFSFVCSNCKSVELTIKHISINREWTLLVVECQKCKKEATINVSEIEIDAWSGVLEKAKPNGGGKK